MLSEDKFLYDPNWVKAEIKSSLEFWMGKREPRCTPEEERWKCKYCRFAPLCPINQKPEDKQPDQD